MPSASTVSNIKIEYCSLVSKMQTNAQNPNNNNNNNNAINTNNNNIQILNELNNNNNNNNNNKILQQQQQQTNMHKQQQQQLHQQKQQLQSSDAITTTPSSTTTTTTTTAAKNTNNNNNNNHTTQTTQSMYNNHNKLFTNIENIENRLFERYEDKLLQLSNNNSGNNERQYHYVKNYDQSILAQWLKESVINYDYTQNNAVIKWLQDLRMMSENECLCVLQAKSLINKFVHAKPTPNNNNNNNNNNQEPQQTLKSNISNHLIHQTINIPTNNNNNNKTMSTTNSNNSSYNANINNTNHNYNHNNSSNKTLTSNTQSSSILASSTHESSATNLNEDEKVQEEIQILRSKSNNISIEFTKVIRRMDKGIFHHTSHTIRKLVNFIHSVINDFNESISYHTSKIASSAALNSKSTSLSTLQILINSHTLKEEQENLLTDASRLIKYTEKLGLNGKKPDKKILYEYLGKLGQSYEKFYQSAMRFYLRVQLNSILQNSDPNRLKLLLNSTIELCLQDEEITKIIIEENGILILFQILCNPHYFAILDTILRTISTLCSCSDCIESMEQVGGVGCLTNILCNEEAEEWIRAEAAGCIAQLTSPTLDLCHRLTGFIENMEDLIQALTVLCRDASDTEIFLIATAALAHMTFMDSIACEFLHQFGTAQIIIENFYLKNHNSIFIKDQITTILANMALLENCRDEIVEYSGLNLLADFLHERPSNYLNNNFKNDNNLINNTLNSEDGLDIRNKTADLDDNRESELTACERVQQKSAIAINRFSKEPQYALMLVELGVVPRLVTLCRNANERNNSDAVLVACLAALRQLALVCDSNVLRENDVQQLIRPRLRDSFLMCSSAEESYV